MPANALPDREYSSVEAVIADHFGSTVRIQSASPVGGGDINEASRLTLTDGTALFLKTNTLKNYSFFTAEAMGLSAIRQTNTIQVPKLLGIGKEEARRGCSFLLLEWCDSTSLISSYWEVFGRELAALHQAPTSEPLYGFDQDNYIGASEQINSPRSTWLSFFRECRLQPQFERASRYFSPFDKKKIQKFLDRLEDLLIEPEHPSLLHGDLWSGNFITGPDGKAWLIDPAVYVGNAEADLAMTELFGGFRQTFYDAYREASPLLPGYEDRRDIYNLYHLLNHVNLFGRGYLSGVMRILNRYA